MRFRIPEIVFGFLLATAVWSVAAVVIPPQQNQHIQQTDSGANSKTDQHHISKSFWERLSKIWNRTWEDPVAFFTFMLSIFTMLLVIVSSTQIAFLIRADHTARKAAEAADASAKAIAVVERAYVYPIIVGHGLIGECINNALVFYLGDVTKDDVPAQETAEITFKLKNFGKTPAILKTAFVGVGVSPLGAQIGVPIVESVLGVGEETVTPLVATMEVGITRRQAQHILAYTGHVCFEGSVTFDDIWGNEHRTEFYFVWDHWISRMNLRWVETKTTQKEGNPSP